MLGRSYDPNGAFRVWRRSVIVQGCPTPMELELCALAVSHSREFPVLYK